MRTLIGTLIKDLVKRTLQRHDTKLLIERMAADPRALEDIGLTLDEFAALQWRGLERTAPPRRKAQMAGIGMPLRILPDMFTVHRAPRAHG